MYGEANPPGWMQEWGEKRCFLEEGPSIISQPMEGLWPSPPFPHPTQKELMGNQITVRIFPSFHASHGRLVESQDPGSNMNWLASNYVRNTWDLAQICFVRHTENFIQTKWVRIINGRIDGQQKALCVAPHSSAVQFHHHLHPMLPTDRRKN